MTDQGGDFIVMPTTARVDFGPSSSPAQTSMRVRSGMPVWTQYLMPPGEPDHTMEVRSDRLLQIMVRARAGRLDPRPGGSWPDEDEKGS